MFLRQALAGMMQLFAVFAFFAIGFACVSLPFSEHLRYRIISILLEDIDFAVWIGLGFFLLTFLLICGFYGAGKGRFLLLRMGELMTEVDVNVVKKTISSQFAKQFSSRVLLTDVQVFKYRELQISLAIAPMEEKEKILLEAEDQLRDLLANRFGYRRPFTVQVKE
jgi:hypothetical protein